MADRRSRLLGELTRFGPFSSQCRAGNVKIPAGSWNEESFRVLEGFPKLAHDDEVDACSGALEMLSPAMKNWGYYDWLRRAAEKLNPTVKPEPPKTIYARDSVEWQAEQEEKRKAQIEAGAVEVSRSPPTGTNSSNLSVLTPESSVSAASAPSVAADLHPYNALFCTPMTTPFKGKHVDENKLVPS